MDKQLKNKKIVMMIVNDFSHDSRVYNEATTAYKAGMKVYLLAHKSPQTKFKEKLDGINIIRVETWVDRLWTRVSGQKKAAKKVVEQKTELTKPSKLVIYGVLASIYAMNKAFIKETLKIKPDIVHCNDSTTLITAHKLKSLGYKVVFDSHELYSESLADPDPVWKAFYVRLEKKINRLDGVFTVCTSILNELNNRYNIQKLPQAVLYNSPTYMKVETPKPNKEVKFLYIGRHHKTQDFNVLNQAIEKIPHATLTNVGPGWQESKNPKIINLKPFPYTRLIKEINIRNFDVGIIPYIPNCLNNRYSTPNKLFEYMMAGMAIAASNLPEIRKVVKKYHNGILFNPTSAKDIAEKLSFFVKNKKNLLNLRQNSLLAAKEYNWDNQAEKQLTVYKKVLTK